jgi:hypothetical protein
MSHTALAPFVVTGMPRSGTSFTAAVLGRLGIDCGHEEVFHPQLSHYQGMGRWDGDSSWLATPFLTTLPSEVLVIHQVRHPLLVAGSLIGTRFLEPQRWSSARRDDAWAHTKWRARRALVRTGHLEHVTASPRPLSAFQEFLRRNAPQIWQERTPIERALRFWIDWNELVLAAPATNKHLRVQVEALDAGQLVALVDFLGLRISLQHASFALAKVPADLNQRAREQVAWADVPQGRTRDEAAALAQRLGYDPAVAHRGLGSRKGPG